MASDMRRLLDETAELQRLLNQAKESKDHVGAAVIDMERELQKQRADKQASLEAIVEHQSKFMDTVHQGLSRAETLATKAIRLQEELQEVAKQQEATVTMIDKEKTYQRKVLGFPCVPLRVGGQQIEVGIDTLLLNTPEGSYFRGLLRQYGVDGETDARVQLEDAIRRNGGSLPLDEDPDTFKVLVNYLRYANNPTMAAKDPKSLLLPDTDPQLSMLLAAAERLGLDSLGSLAPPGDIISHLTAGDAQMRAEEERHREAFVSDPKTMVQACERGELLLDVFEPSVHCSFVYEEGPSPYPRLFTHLEHPTADLPAGSRSVVRDRDAFQKNFKHFTGGLFEGIDWGNMIVAGGSVLACLMRPPCEIERRSDAWVYKRPNDTENKALLEWLGPNYTDDVDDMEVDHGHGSTTTSFMHLASSGFGDSDIDVFFYGLAPKAADDKLQQLMQQLHSNGQSCVSVAARSEHAMTMVLSDDSRRAAAHVQVVLRLYSCPAEVLMGFDIDSCCVAYDGSRVYATPRAHRAVNGRQNIADPSRLSPSYESRLAKYARRGFPVAVPGFPGRSRINSTIYLKSFPELQGLSRLIRIEQRFIRSSIQMGQIVSYSKRPSLPRRQIMKGKASESWWGVAVLEEAAADALTADAAAWAAGEEAHDAVPIKDQERRGSGSGNHCDYSSLHLPKYLDPEDMAYYLPYMSRKMHKAGQQFKTVWQVHDVNPYRGRVTAAAVRTAEEAAAAVVRPLAGSSTSAAAAGRVLLVSNINFMTRLTAEAGGPAAVAALANAVAAINPAAGLTTLASTDQQSPEGAHLAAAAAIGAAAAAIGVDTQQLHITMTRRPATPLAPAAAAVARGAAVPPIPAHQQQSMWNGYVFDATPLLQKYPGLQLGIPTQLQWMTENPGRQGRLTGSFQPIDGRNWTHQAYEIVPNA